MAVTQSASITIRPDDALVLADIQNDFLPGGSLAVPRSDTIIPRVRLYLTRFLSVPAPIFLTRDWHPRHHCSFRAQGGPWPEHCVAETRGAAPPEDLWIPDAAVIVHKATRVDQEVYSAFQGTHLNEQLKAVGARRLFIGGLATEYCVLNSVRDARRLRYPVYLLMDAIGAIDRNPGDGLAAEREMIELGAVPIRFEDLTT